MDRQIFALWKVRGLCLLEWQVTVICTHFKLSSQYLLHFVCLVAIYRLEYALLGQHIRVALVAGLMTPRALLGTMTLFSSPDVGPWPEEL